MDNVGIIALDQLLRAADRGVQVRMLVDDFLLDVDGRRRGGIECAPQHHHPRLQPHGRQKHAGQGAPRAGRLPRVQPKRMHNKTFVVDGRVAITGGRNIADEYFDYDQGYNFRDRDVLLLGDGRPERSKPPLTRSGPTRLPRSWQGDNATAADPSGFYDKIHAYACDPENFWPEIRALIDGIPEAIPRLIAAGRLHRLEGMTLCL